MLKLEYTRPNAPEPIEYYSDYRTFVNSIKRGLNTGVVFAVPKDKRNIDELYHVLLVESDTDEIEDIVLCTPMTEGITLEDVERYDEETFINLINRYNFHCATNLDLINFLNNGK